MRLQKSIMKLTKNKFLIGYAAIVAVLVVVKCVYPSVSEGATVATNESVAAASGEPAAEASSTQALLSVASSSSSAKRKYHRIMSVPSYKEAFPDSQTLQIVAAEKWGVRPVKNRADAESRKRELVFVGASPYYHVDPLYSSIPYLVPRAAILLQDIGEAFYDSLYVKGVPFHKLIVTSVLRSEEDVVKLRRRNGNATERSCHLFGTTFDICYNRYLTVEDPEGPSRWSVRNDTLKWVLSEVLRDMRQQNRCYIKYEVKQGCFHMTVR